MILTPSPPLWAQSEVWMLVCMCTCENIPHKHSVDVSRHQQWLGYYDGGEGAFNLASYTCMHTKESALHVHTGSHLLMALQSYLAGNNRSIRNQQNLVEQAMSRHKFTCTSLHIPPLQNQDREGVSGESTDQEPWHHHIWQSIWCQAERDCWKKGTLYNSYIHVHSVNVLYMYSLSTSGNQHCIYIYRISSNRRPGVYFLRDSADPAFKRGRRLNGAGVYLLHVFLAHAHPRYVAHAEVDRHTQ